MDLGLLVELAGQDAVPFLQGVAGFHAELAQHPDRGHTVLLAVAALRLGGALAALGIHETDLDGLIALLGGGLALDDDAGTGLDDGDGDDLPLFIEDLGHAQLLSDDSFAHCLHPSLYRLP